MDASERSKLLSRLEAAGFKKSGSHTVELTKGHAIVRVRFGRMFIVRGEVWGKNETAIQSSSAGQIWDWVKYILSKISPAKPYGNT